MKQTPPLSPVVAQELSLTNNIGIYIHIPFCSSKCNYCNFYSVEKKEKIEAYVDKCIEEITRWGGLEARPVSSIYIGGGTPSLLSSEQFQKIVNAINKNFAVQQNAEITAEVNPGDNLGYLLPSFFETGCNRLSIGVQSGLDDELKILGRRHTVKDAALAVETARKVGFSNISLDLMTALPFSTPKTLENSLRFVLSLQPEHISTYMLKLEEGTPLYQKRDMLIFPDDDAAAEQYLQVSECLTDAGYEHYEISNFAKKGFHSRHNTLYWECGEYLGVGPFAHSFLNGKRFYYQNDLDSFLKNPVTVFDGNGGSEDEYIMLGLRLKNGISSTEFLKRYGRVLPSGIFKKARLFHKNGLCVIKNDNISLTAKGMLLSNSIIAEFSEELI